MFNDHVRTCTLFTPTILIIDSISTNGIIKETTNLNHAVASTMTNATPVMSNRVSLRPQPGDCVALKYDPCQTKLEAVAMPRSDPI